MGAGEGGSEVHSGFTGCPDLRAVLTELCDGSAAGDLFAVTPGAGAFAFLRTWPSTSSCSIFVGAGRVPLTLTPPGLAAGTWPVMSKEAQDPDRLGVACLGAQGRREFLKLFYRDIHTLDMKYSKHLNKGRHDGQIASRQRDWLQLH